MFDTVEHAVIILSTSFSAQLLISISIKWAFVYLEDYWSTYTCNVFYEALVKAIDFSDNEN